MKLNKPQIVKIITEALKPKDSNPRPELVGKPSLNKNTDDKDRSIDSFFLFHGSTWFIVTTGLVQVSRDSDVYSLNS